MTSSRSSRKEEQSDLLAAYHRRLHGPDCAVQQSAAVAFARWEACLSRLLPDPHVIARFAESGQFRVCAVPHRVALFRKRRLFAHDGSSSPARIVWAKSRR